MSDPAQIPFMVLADGCYCQNGYRTGECGCCKAEKMLRAAPDHERVIAELRAENARLTAENKRLAMMAGQFHPADGS